MSPDSTTQVMTRSGLKSFDRSHWQQAVMRKKNCNAEEAQEVMNAYTTHRAQVGTDFHLCVETWLKGGTEPPRAVDAEAMAILQTWRLQFLIWLGEVLIIESPMVHPFWFYAGTPDLLCRYKGELWIVDWKTKAVNNWNDEPNKNKEKRSEEWVMQAAAYRELIRSVYGLEVDRAMNCAIWDGGMKLHEYNRADLDQAWAEFQEGVVVNYQVRAAEGRPFAAEWLRHAAPDRALQG